MKRKRVKANPCGTDAEFDAYMRASQRKFWAAVIGLLLLCALFLAM